MSEFIGIIDVQCTLGESPVWDERLNCLWWTDIQEGRLYRWDWNERIPVVLELPERLGSLGLTSDPEWLVCAFASGFALFHPASVRIYWLERPEAEYRGIRMNDGRVDRQGHFWAGSMVESPAFAPESGGSLYRLDPDGNATELFDGISVSNSICFSPAGDQIYFTDTPTQQIRILTHDTESGVLSGNNLFAAQAGKAFPDGSDVDAKGCLWNAEWGASCITCYRPDGSKSRHISLPVSQPTSVAFGGPDLDLLFVTSAREGLTDEALACEPDAGKVLILKPASKGLPASKFSLDRLQEMIQ